MDDGSLGAMACGQVLQFLGWDELRAMPAETLKAWLLSKPHAQDAQFVSVVAGSQEVVTHRGAGAVRAERPGRPEQLRGDQAAHDEAHEVEAQHVPPTVPRQVRSREP